MSVADCPFCRARQRTISKLPNVGARFRFLSGFDAGRCGTVVESPSTRFRDEFVAHLDGEPKSLRRQVQARELIEIIPTAHWPTWIPPIEIRLAEEFDRKVLRFCKASDRGTDWAIDWLSFFEIVRFIWSRRLPIAPEEVWEVLAAHGVPPLVKLEVSNFFRRGHELLIYCAGKKPIKKNRVPAT